MKVGWFAEGRELDLRDEIFGGSSDSAQFLIGRTDRRLSLFEIFYLPFIGYLFFFSSFLLFACFPFFFPRFPLFFLSLFCLFSFAVLAFLEVFLYPLWK